MANYATKVRLYAADNGVENVEFRDDVVLTSSQGVVSITTWNLDIPKPSDETLATYESAADAYEAAAVVASKRRNAYPEIGDQLDALFHAGVFPAEMAAKIQAVKDLYPKA